MSRLPRFLPCGLMAALATLLIMPAATAEDAAPTLEPRDAWSNVFGDKEVALRFTVKVAKAWRGRAVWSFAAENGRTLNRGEVDVTADADKPGDVAVTLRTPPVK